MNTSTSSSSRKRRRSTESDANNGSTQEPPPKRSTRSSLRSSARSDPQATEAEAQPSNRLQDDALSETEDSNNIVDGSEFSKWVKSYYKVTEPPFELVWLKNLSVGVEKKRVRDIEMAISIIEKWLRKVEPPKEKQLFDESWKALKAEIFKPSPPSTFAHAKKWVPQQEGPAFINCLRPPHRRGLPLKLLHPLFARFSALLQGPPPDYSDSQYVTAEAAAIALCQEMPKSFESEQERLKEFRMNVCELFNARLDEVGVGDSTARADFGILSGSPAALILVGEGKNEPGGGAGDPYMQVSASYDAWVRVQPDSPSGHPCFVFCVDGPNIAFGGGFRDGDVSVVEPLSGWCVMLPDVGLERERILARHLYTLKKCLSDISKFTDPLPSGIVRCPRVYNTFSHSDKEEGVRLHFIAPFTNPWSQSAGRNLLFEASFKDKSGDQHTVLVKVPIGSGYGHQAHLLASSSRFAPRLYGTAALPGAYPIFVMELLRTADGWFHMRQNELPNDISDAQKKAIQSRGEELLSFLSTNQLVHGDLRDCNVMCRLDGNKADIRVLDWDWAEKQGVARYPSNLNPTAGYQGKAGEVIVMDHDRTLFNQTLGKLFKGDKVV